MIVLVILILMLIFAIYEVINNPYVANYFIGKKAGWNKDQRAVVYAQMQYETADFTSNVYKQGNNVSGMTVASSRPQQGVVGQFPAGHAKFNNVWNSVKDLYVWLGLHGIKPTSNPVVYCGRLKLEKYFSAPLETYTKGVVQYMNVPNKKAWMLPLVLVVMVLAAVLLLWLLIRLIIKAYKRAKLHGGRMRSTS